MFNKSSIAAVAALSLLSANSAMALTTVSGTAFTVKVAVTAGCAITTDIPNAAGINFGSVAGTSAVPGSQSANATVTCTNTTPYGLHMTSTNAFNMKNGATSIAYTVNTLLNGTCATYAIGGTAAGASLTNTGTGAGQTYPFTFAITPASWSSALPIGTYSDTVTLNVDF